jgi:hypothetical protein
MMIRIVDLIVGAVKGVGEAALRLYDENVALRHERDALLDQVANLESALDSRDRALGFVPVEELTPPGEKT